MGIFDIFTRMDEAFEERMNSESLETGVKRAAILFAVLGVFGGLAVAAITLLLPSGPGGNNVVGALLAFFIILVGCILGGLLYLVFINFITWLPARILGGRGGFGQQFGLSTLLLWPTFIVFLVMFVPLFVLMLIPIIGWIIAIFWVLLIYSSMGFFYGLSFYFAFLILKQLHGLSTFRSAISIGLSVLLFMLIVGAIYFVLILVLGTAVLSALKPPATGFLGLP